LKEYLKALDFLIINSKNQLQKDGFEPLRYISTIFPHPKEKKGINPGLYSNILEEALPKSLL
jgi:hypothetical protein